ncbi:MAG: hypothetical protein U9Q83_11195 [Bacteroidota bacterium]|nr:hypothetical protein [Bacteroidota bacterium]
MSKIYTYDYPEQRELAKDLRVGDTTLLSDLTGYSLSSITRMCRGQRRMADIVKLLIYKIYEVRLMMGEYAEEQKQIIKQ